VARGPRGTARLSVRRFRSIMRPMKKTTVFGFGLAALLLGLPAVGSAQLHVSIGIAFPEPPPLVVVSPGIQIVPEYDEEVFFANSWYWVRRDDVWYRTRDYRGGWVPARRAWVPPGLMRLPPGHYRHYYRDDDGRWRPHGPDEFRAWRERNPPDERRGWWRDHRHDEKVRWEQRNAWRQQPRPERAPQRAGPRGGLPGAPAGGPPPRGERREDRPHDHGHH
jgi:hypothetical protein